MEQNTTVHIVELVEWLEKYKTLMTHLKRLEEIKDDLRPYDHDDKSKNEIPFVDEDGEPAGRRYILDRAKLEVRDAVAIKAGVSFAFIDDEPAGLTVKEAEKHLAGTIVELTKDTQKPIGRKAAQHMAEGYTMGVETALREIGRSSHAI